jgi:hypothetical protein
MRSIILADGTKVVAPEKPQGPFLSRSIFPERLPENDFWQYIFSSDSRKTKLSSEKDFKGTIKHYLHDTSN